MEGTPPTTHAHVHPVSSASASPAATFVLTSHCDGQKLPHQFRISFYLSPLCHVGQLL